MTPADRRIGLLGAPIVVAISMLAAGCQHNADALASNSTGNGETRPTGVTKEESIKAVEDNPHIPAQVKANIIRQLKGEVPSGPPSTVK